MPKRIMSFILRCYNKFLRISRCVLRFFIGFIPRDRKLIVYGGALDLFIDNTKHLFIYNNTYDSMKSYKHVWLSNNEETLSSVRNLGLKSIKSSSLEGIWTILRAKFVLYDNRINEFSCHDFTQGAIRIEIWHGLPLKMWGSIKSDNQDFYTKKSNFIEKYNEVHYLGDYCVSTASPLDRYFSAAFKIPQENIIHATYPRNTVMLLQEDLREKYISKYESALVQEMYHTIKANANKKVVYMPTFRDKKPLYISEAIPDFEVLNTFCKSNSITLYLKVHRVTPLPKDMNFSNIRVIDNSIDMYPLMSLFDLLITDYSSIMYDFALLHKPIALYTYDIEEYSKQSRNIYKFFWTLRNQLTNVVDFNGFMSIMNAKKEKFVQFPVDQFYEWPFDIEAINKKIKELSTV